MVGTVILTSNPFKAYNFSCFKVKTKAFRDPIMLKMNNLTTMPTKLKPLKPITYLLLSFCVFVLFCLGGCSPAEQQDTEQEVAGSAEKPYNILWITTEDMSPRMGCYGDEVARTPTLDKLASEGLRYTHAFSVSGVCAPSRSALITGLYPTSYGAQHMRTMVRTSAIADITDPELLAIPTYEAVPPPEVKCFSEILRAAGYYTTNNFKTDYQFALPITAWDESSREAHWRNRPEGMPFFAVFNFTVTHESQVWKRADDPSYTDPAEVSVPPYYPDTEVVRRDIARHYDNIAIMDSLVGNLLEQLEADGLTENTIIFFYGDHGDGLPRAKRWIYDSGLRVPLLVKFPDGSRQGEVTDRLVSFVDFAPTVLSLAGIPIPDYMHGKAFLGEQEAEPRQYVYAARDRMDPATATRRAVRDKRFKYIKNYQPDKPYLQFLPYRDRMALMQEIHRMKADGKLNEQQWQWTADTKPEEELYDTETDPHEIVNLASDPEYQSTLQRLRQAHQAWRSRYPDLGHIPETELKKQLWPPDGEQPTTAKPIAEIKALPGGEQTVALSSTTEGASIAYRTMAGPDHRWELYTDPLQLSPNDSLYAKAIRIGLKESEPLSIRVN